MDSNCLCKYLVGKVTKEVLYKYKAEDWKGSSFSLYYLLPSPQISHAQIYIAVAMTNGYHDANLRYRK